MRCALGTGVQTCALPISDRYHRRRVIIACFAATLAVSIALAMAPTGTLLLALGALFGGLSFALYPLCVAFANDRLLPSERVTASGQLVLDRKSTRLNSSH